MATISGKFIWKNGFPYDNYDDTIVGTSRNDTIYGLGGDDEIWAGAGIDVVYGGYGNDVIHLTGTGNDVINLFQDQGTPQDNLWGPEEAYGQGGNDTIIGSWTDDILEGGDGLDDLYGRGGNDEIYGNADRDQIWGQSGTDKLFGGTGNDDLYGGDGVDVLSGNEGYDWLDGGNHDDILQGGAGGDVLIGGSGFDVFYYSYGAESPIGNPDVIVDFSPIEDWIELEPVQQGGPLGNYYVEDTISYGAGYEAAKAHAESLFGNSLPNDPSFVFVTDQVNGYLFGDFEPEIDSLYNEINEIIDMGIYLVGLTSTSDFGPNFLI
jgi:Ca2+-binding RTX toxin-like protein